MPTIQPEETVKSEIVFPGRMITVRRDTVRLPNGKSTERETVEHARTIAVVPVLDDGRIVMIRQYRKSVERVLLELPAGGIDGDESPENAARREMTEETGYTAGHLEPLTEFFTSPGFTNEYMYLYRATQLQAGQPTEATDQIEVVTLGLDEALQRMRSGEVADAKTQLGLLMAQHML